MTQQVLCLQNVDIAYRAAFVVENVTFDVCAGETFGLIGLNGAGKTSLIKAMLGLRQPQRGSITVFDKDVFDKRARRDLVYLPEHFEPPWFLTGIEFIRFALGLYNQPLKRDALEECAISLALDPAVLKNRVQTYSKGMRQKLGLMSALLAERRLIILDEPMSGLDPMARSLLKERLKAIKAKGQTLLICSHILSDLDSLCDRLALLHEGRVSFLGSPQKLKQKTGQDTLERAFLEVVESEEKACYTCE